MSLEEKRKRSADNPLDSADNPLDREDPTKRARSGQRYGRFLVGAMNGWSPS